MLRKLSLICAIAGAVSHADVRRSWSRTWSRARTRSWEVAWSRARTWSWTRSWSRTRSWEVAWSRARTWTWTLARSWRTLARPWRALVARSLVGLWRRLMLAVDPRWLYLDLRLLSSGQRRASATVGALRLGAKGDSRILRRPLLSLSNHQGTHHEHKQAGRAGSARPRNCFANFLSNGETEARLESLSRKGLERKGPDGPTY
jgi:hypothetical protein